MKVSCFRTAMNREKQSQLPKSEANELGSTMRRYQSQARVRQRASEDMEEEKKEEEKEPENQIFDGPYENSLPQRNKNINPSSIQEIPKDPEIWITKYTDPIVVALYLLGRIII